MTAVTGISTGEFDQIYDDLSVATSYKVCTRTTDAITGSETTSFASATTVNGVFYLEENRYVWDKSGLISVGDAYLIVKTVIGAQRYDQITYNSQTYYVENITRREMGGIQFFDFLTLFKVA